MIHRTRPPALSNHCTLPTGPCVNIPKIAGPELPQIPAVRLFHGSFWNLAHELLVPYFPVGLAVSDETPLSGAIFDLSSRYVLILYPFHSCLCLRVLVYHYLVLYLLAYFTHNAAFVCFLPVHCYFGAFDKVSLVNEGMTGGLLLLSFSLEALHAFVVATRCQRLSTFDIPLPSALSSLPLMLGHELPSTYLYDSHFHHTILAMLRLIYPRFLSYFCSFPSRPLSRSNLESTCTLYVSSTGPTCIYFPL